MPMLLSTVIASLVTDRLARRLSAQTSLGAAPAALPSIYVCPAGEPEPVTEAQSSTGVTSLVSSEPRWVRMGRVQLERWAPSHLPGSGPGPEPVKARGRIALDLVCARPPAGSTPAEQPATPALAGDGMVALGAGAGALGLEDLRDRVVYAMVGLSIHQRGHRVTVLAIADGEPALPPMTGGIEVLPVTLELLCERLPAGSPASAPDNAPWGVATV